MDTITMICTVIHTAILTAGIRGTGLQQSGISTVAFSGADSAIGSVTDSAADPATDSASDPVADSTMRRQDEAPHRSPAAARGRRRSAVPAERSAVQRLRASEVEE
jgi:hypothetical protein